jgi:eukaryotic-like serine/threonine-protein kinase
MAIQPGTRLGLYEIASLIGAGGMGEVYRAHDTRLNRDVALKVLPEALAHDMQRMARFEREAKLLASLNHPNIAAIYGFEESGPIRALVMELVEGPTLAERIAAGPMPLDQALPIARQVADAVEYAHDKNVIHRDLKPANIKVKEDGTVKVLDFGLAKALSDDPTERDMSNSPTLSMAATRQGVILGTAAYMAPEQARGKTADRRADIWAFGVVLYEMLTGKRAFEGEDVSLILAAVMKSEPDWESLPADLPPAVRLVLRRCLQKDPKQRLQAIGDVRLAMEGAFETSTFAPAKPTVPADVRTLGRPALLLSIGTAVLTAVLTGIAAWMLWSTPLPRPLSRFGYDLPQDHQFRNTGRVVMALSPDGSRFVYNAAQGLYLRSMDQLEARLIPGTEAALSNPFFSPDGQWVGYFQVNQLKKIAISGGAPVTICAATNPFSVSWGPDNTILFSQAEGILRVSADGGTPELVIKSGEGERLDGPQLLPGSEWVLFAVRKTTWDEARIVVQSLKTQERRDVWQGGSDARYLPTGHIVYALGGDLFAIPFNLGSLKVNGGPVPLVQGVLRANATAGANYGVSEDGAMVYVSGGAGVGTQSLVWLDRAGKEEAINAPPRGYIYPRISPDSTRVALDVRDRENDIVVWDLRRETLTRFTPTPEGEHYPAWTRDSQRLAYATLPSGIQWKAADGSGVAESIGKAANSEQDPYFFTPDGKQLVYRQTDRGLTDVGMVSVEGDSDPVWLLESQFVEGNAELSPDGRWMAYESNESGDREIYVRPFPNVNEGLHQVSGEGGIQPVWSRDGRELFYLQPGQPYRLMAAPVRTGTTFDSGSPRALFDWTYPEPGPGGRTYDVSADGRRFLALKAFAGSAGADVPPPRIIVVQNWLEDLKQRVPTGN